MIEVVPGPSEPGGGTTPHAPTPGLLSLTWGEGKGQALSMCSTSYTDYVVDVPKKWTRRPLPSSSLLVCKKSKCLRRRAIVGVSCGERLCRASCRYRFLVFSLLARIRVVFLRTYCFPFWDQRTYLAALRGSKQPVDTLPAKRRYRLIFIRLDFLAGAPTNARTHGLPTGDAVPPSTTWAEVHGGTQSMRGCVGTRPIWPKH